jgi:hypothetical protein
MSVLNLFTSRTPLEVSAGQYRFPPSSDVHRIVCADRAGHTAKQISHNK